MSRMTDLLTAAADAMDDGIDPFHVSFLSEHEVTLDEAYDMSERIAQAVRCWLAIQGHEGLLVAAVAMQTCNREIADAALHSYLMNDTAKKIAAVGKRDG